MTVFQKCDGYLNAREGTYAYRCRRYDAVIDKLEDHGLDDDMTIVDLGAGWTEFGHRLSERGWRGRYLPYDGAIDGQDLGFYWQAPLCEVDYVVAIELLEHLQTPFKLLDRMIDVAQRGVVVTTPDSDHVDTLGMDADHVRALTYDDLMIIPGMQVQQVQLFPGSPWTEPGQPDTLLGWWFR